MFLYMQSVCFLLCFTALVIIFIPICVYLCAPHFVPKQNKKIRLIIESLNRKKHDCFPTFCLEADIHDCSINQCVYIHTQFPWYLPWVYSNIVSIHRGILPMLRLLISIMLIWNKKVCLAFGIFYWMTIILIL